MVINRDGLGDKNLGNMKKDVEFLGRRMEWKFVFLFSMWKMD